jgi:starvation-inducible DNA-binding protein
MSSKKVAAPVIDFGIGDKDRAKVVDGLSHLLADTYTLYLKTHNFHWNVTGPMFQTLHLMFMGMYTEQWAAVDLLPSVSVRWVSQHQEPTNNSPR